MGNSKWLGFQPIFNYLPAILRWSSLRIAGMFDLTKKVTLRFSLGMLYCFYDSKR
jgi:hypothetical protein